MCPNSLRVTVFVSCTFTCLAIILNSDDTQEILSVHSGLFVDKNGPDICNARKCLYKCCSDGEYIATNQENQLRCDNYNGTLDFYNVTLYNEVEHDEKTSKKLGDIFLLKTNRLSNDTFSLKDPYNFVVDPYYTYYLSESGSLYLHIPNSYTRWIVMDPELYCVDYDVTSPEPVMSFWCVSFADDPPDNPYYTSALLVSFVFLLLVFIVYLLLPELRNLGGKVLMAYVFSQMFAFLSLAVIRLDTYAEDVCISLTFLMFVLFLCKPSISYFFFLSSFCWMNVMSYDIFWTFRGYAKARPIHRRGECFKFIMYGLYAWGVPLAMTIMLVTLNSLNLTDKPWIILPLIPRQGCFLEGGQKFVYLYIPMLIMIFCNWFFFLMTSFNIWRLSRGTQVLHSPAAGNSAAHRTHKTRFILYLKLSAVMGINWLLEVIGSFYPDFIIWCVTDMYNLLIGIIIFLIFVAKRKICQNVLAKLRGIRLPQTSFYKSSTHSTVESNLSQEIPLRVTRHPRGHADIK